MLEDKHYRAISSFNTKDGLLEEVLNHLRKKYFDEWLSSKEDHSKQRESLYMKAIVIEDVIKLIREATNKQIFD